MLLFLEFFLFFYLIYIRLKILELFLSWSLTFLIIVYWLRYWFNWSISNRNKDGFLVLMLFFPFHFFLLLCKLFSQLWYSNFIFNNSLNSIMSFSMFILIIISIICIKKRSSNISLDRGNFRLGVFCHFNIYYKIRIV